MKIETIFRYFRSIAVVGKITVQNYLLIGILAVEKCNFEERDSLSNY